MREMVKMVIVLTVLSSLSGGLLAALHDTTKDRIENQVLKFVQGPAVEKIMEKADNDPVADRFSVKAGEEEMNFFVGIFDENPKSVAFETSASGYGGDVGVIVAIDIENNEIFGVEVTTHNETPGIGATVETDEEFKKQFKGMNLDNAFEVKDDDGDINAIAGATVTSRAVCKAVQRAVEIYRDNKSQINDQVKTFTG